MQPRIELLAEKKLIGKSLCMSFAQNKTVDLWRSFMPGKKEIKKVIGTELYSLEVYDAAFFNQFNPNNEFEKWAAVEVSDFEFIPEGMQTLTIPSGLYAVFLHKGPASDGAKTYEYIFKAWLPNSGFQIDQRPHFAIMGEKYKHEDVNSEEEIWIPIRDWKLV